MAHIERNPGLLTAEERQCAIDAIIGYFRTERGETIGVIAAEELLDFFLEHAGKSVYNAALAHARKALASGLEETDFTIGELQL